MNEAIKLRPCVESSGNKVPRKDQDVGLDEAEDNERRNVGKLGSFGTVTQSQNKLDDEESQVKILENRVDDGRCAVAEGPGSVCR
ncbi:hypothetical protein HYQ46_011994 [Verticillium longisporum]|nr:hypothetical protein HYQ46_011994 [Verticillium longisporum]